MYQLEGGRCEVVMQVAHDGLMVVMRTHQWVWPITWKSGLVMR